MTTRTASLKLVAALASVLCLQSAAGQAQAARHAPRRAVREAFSAAYEAALAGAKASQNADSRALRAYPLYPYLQAARIEHALDALSGARAAADDRAAAFLQAHAGEPVAEPLREAWLSGLASRGLWQAFVDAYRPESATPTLQCLDLTARTHVDAGDGLERAIAAKWLTAAPLPTECEPAFQWLRAQGALTDELVAQRVRMLLAAGHAKFAELLAQRLPDERAAPLRRWAAMIVHPQQSIDALIDGRAPMPDPRVLLAGWTELATRDPDAALQRFDALLRALRLSAHEVSLLSKATALGLAWDRRPQALAFFSRIDPADVDDYTLEWQARAAMWAGAWPLVARSIASMSDEQRRRSAWRYWAGRAADELQRPADAKRLYEWLLPKDNYYAAMAAARLHRDMAPHARPLPRDAAELRKLAAKPPFLRAHELLALGLRTAATREWQFGLDALSPAARRQSIHLAAAWGWYDVAVSTATDERVFYAYRALYPEPYSRTVAAASELTQIDEPLIYALLRQESLFYAKTASPAGALGLSQLLPSTARRVARKWHQRIPQRADLLDPAVNIKLGAAQLRTLIDALGGQVAPGLAAYNAGRSNVEHWLPERPVDEDVWIENIPYNETRAYVRHVLWHSLVFKWLDSGRAQDASSWLARVRPRGTQAEASRLKTPPAREEDGSRS
jgi:soluble lytic murein transglycosylase